GIVLSGGGSLLKKLDDMISNETKMPVFIAEAPLDIVAIGNGKSLDYIQHFRTRPKVSSRPTVEYVGVWMQFFTKKRLYILIKGIILYVSLIVFSLLNRTDLT